MLITCPHCETIFRIDTADIQSKGRKVRCSICTHVWLAKRSGADAIIKEAGLIERRKWRGGLTVFIVAVIAVIVLMTMGRNFIGANLPSTIPIYEKVGLPITSRIEKLEVIRLSASRKRDTIKISGDVNNLSNWSMLAPALLITVTDDSGLVLSEKRISLDVDIIKGARSIPFAAQIILDQQLDDDDLTEIVVIPTAAPY